MFSYISHYVLFFISPSGATDRGSSIEVSLIDVEYRNSTYKLLWILHQPARWGFTGYLTRDVNSPRSEVNILDLPLGPNSSANSTVEVTAHCL